MAARDLEGHRYVTLIFYTRDAGDQEGFDIYKRLNQGSKPPWLCLCEESTERRLTRVNSIDIWNVGLTAWDLCEGRLLFCGKDPDGRGYSTRAHLAELIGTLGLPPMNMLQRGKRSHDSSTDDGMGKQDIEILRGVSVETSEQFLEGRDKEMFLRCHERDDSVAS